MRSIPLLLLALMFLSCRPNSTECIAGTGGHVNVVVYANHNSMGLLNYGNHIDTAFVKFNTLTAPGTDPGKYDTFFTGEPGENHIHCQNLKCGDYYIYRIAYDSVTNTRYTGGIGISFSMAGGEIDTTVNVN